MEQKDKKIILASNSPRRRELLGSLGVNFSIDTLNCFEEKFPEDMSHREVPALMSKGKSHGFHRKLEEDEILITSDTMVLLDNIIMGKPHSREEGIRMLRSLSGKKHEVITAVTIRNNHREETISDSTLVCFKELTDNEITYYLDNFKPYDKAGAYGIQEWIGFIGITGIEGSFYNVMGFPVHRVYEELLKFL